LVVIQSKSPHIVSLVTSIALLIGCVEKDKGSDDDAVDSPPQAVKAQQTRPTDTAEGVPGYDITTVDPASGGIATISQAEVRAGAGTFATAIELKIEDIGNRRNLENPGSVVVLGKAVEMTVAGGTLTSDVIRRNFEVKIKVQEEFTSSENLIVIVHTNLNGTPKASIITNEFLEITTDGDDTYVTFVTRETSAAFSVAELPDTNTTGYAIYQSPPPEILAVEATTQEEYAITLSWKSDSKGDLKGYLIVYHQSAKPPEDCVTGTVITEGIGKNTSYQLTGLLVDTEYSARLCAFNDSDPQVLSLGATIQTSTIDDVTSPTTPLNLKTPADASDGPDIHIDDDQLIFFAWDASTDTNGKGVRGYVVSYYTQVECGGEATNLSETTATFKSLTGNDLSTYSFKVTAYDNAGNSATSVCSSYLTINLGDRLAISTENDGQQTVDGTSTQYVELMQLNSTHGLSSGDALVYYSANCGVLVDETAGQDVKIKFLKDATALAENVESHSNEEMYHDVSYWHMVEQGDVGSAYKIKIASGDDDMVVDCPKGKIYSINFNAMFKGNDWLVDDPADLASLTTGTWTAAASVTIPAGNSGTKWAVMAKVAHKINSGDSNLYLRINAEGSTFFDEQPISRSNVALAPRLFNLPLIHTVSSNTSQSITIEYKQTMGDGALNGISLLAFNADKLSSFVTGSYDAASEAVSSNTSADHAVSLPSVSFPDSADYLVFGHLNALVGSDSNSKTLKISIDGSEVSSFSSKSLDGTNYRSSVLVGSYDPSTAKDAAFNLNFAVVGDDTLTVTSGSLMMLRFDR
jgi:hypothetical protein